MVLTDLTFIPLSEGIDLSSFDCDDEDINEFLKEDSLNYLREKMASTYLFINNEGCVLLFFSLSNDCIKDLGETAGFTNNIWNRLHRKTKIPNNKRMRQYPAVKIGRLGVHKEHQGSGLSYEMMDFIKGWLSIDHKPAFRFLVLDAYNKERQKKFYIRNGFEFLLSDDENEDTRFMYYDMTLFR